MRLAWVVVAIVLSGCATALPDIELEARANEQGEVWVLEANATNAGDSAVAYRSGCQQAWNHGLFHEGEEIDIDRPTCHGFKEAELAPGQTESLRFVWDGRERADHGRREAPDGEYVWRVEFLTRSGETAAAAEAAFTK